MGGSLSLFERPGVQRVELRPYQHEAIRCIREAFREHRSTLLVMATGVGKTTVFGAVARDWSGRVLVIGHRDELLDQARSRLEKMCGEAVDLEQADFRAGRARLVVASIQTISRPSRLKGDEVRHRGFKADDFSLVIVDEAHHAAASTYRAVLAHFTAAKVLGVTATPDRGDRRALGDVFDSVALEYSKLYKNGAYDPLDAIKDGWLVPLVAERVDIDVDLSQVKTTKKGDLNEDQLDEAMGQQHVLEGVVRPCYERAGDRRTVVFTTSVVNAHKMAAIFNTLRPGCARAVDGGMLLDDRRAVLRGYAHGDFQFLVNVMVATEGWDDPPTSCVAIGRPTKSRALFAQMLGRGLRLSPGKTDCLVLEFAGNAGKHSLVSPLDVLAGRYSDEEVELAKEMAKKKRGEQAHRLLELAKEEIEARARRRVHHQAERFDPFTVFHMDGGGDDVDWQFGRKEPTAGQLAAAKKWRIDVPEGASRRQVSRLIGAASKRADLGLASYGQLKVLQRAGITDINISRPIASQLIEALKANGWQLPRAQADDIIAGSRGVGLWGL